MKIDVLELRAILESLPPGCIDPVVKGRIMPVISVSMPDGAVPDGWEPVNEGKVYYKPGYRRIRWTERSALLEELDNV